MRTKSTSILDILGISSATICLIHCLVFPLITILKIGCLDNPLIDIVFAIIGFFIVSKILISDSNFKIKIILLFSFLTVLLGIVLELILHKHSHLILIGGLGMIIGHIINLKSHKH